MRYLLPGVLLTVLVASPVLGQQDEDDVPTLPPEIVRPTPGEGDEPAEPTPATEPLDPPAEPSPTPPTAAAEPLLPQAFSPFVPPLVDGYRADSSVTGTLLNIPDIDFPGSVDVLPEDLLQDQQILNFDEAIRNVPGAVLAGDGLFPNRIFIRGLEVRSRDFRKNGFLDPTYTPRDFANIQRVEILKGPASVIYGSAAPSGTVNFITEKPLDTNFASGSFYFGSFDLERYEVDANGRVDPEGRFLVRFNAAYENSGSFRDFGFTERHLVAPAVTYVVGPDTTITWEAEFIENRRLGDQGVPTINGDPEFLPPNRFIGEPANDFIYTEDYRTSVVMNHRVNDWVSLNVGASTVFYEFPGSTTAAEADLGGGQFFRFRQEFENQEQASSLIANVVSEFRTGEIDHTFLFGTEFVYYDADSRFSFAQLPPIDVTNPTYNNPPTLGPPQVADFPVFRQFRQGYYLQDYLELNENWAVLGGVRFDVVDFEFDRNLGFGLVSTEQQFYRTSPRAGIVYQPLPDVLSVYFNYAQSFNPPGGGSLGFTGEPVDPELGESFELGIKALLLENLSLNVAGFHVTRENVPFADFGQAGPIFFQVGEERGQGVEIDLIGELTDRWSVFAGYAYVDTELTDPTNPAIFGQAARNVPQNSANLWTRYNLIQERERTLGLGMGLFYVGDRTANLAGNVILPSYTRWDAGLYWRRGPWAAQLYAENIFDIQHAISSVNEFQVFPGAPAGVRAQVGVTY